MKIAYGISAYKDALHLKRLIDALQGKDRFFFVHIDKKCDVAPFEVAVQTISNCKILSKRYSVQWGDGTK